MSAMILRLLFVLSFVIISFSNAINVLEKVSLDDNTLELKFKSDLKPRDINYMTLDDPKREIFDFENSHLTSNLSLRHVNQYPQGLSIPQGSTVERLNQ